MKIQKPKLSDRLTDFLLQSALIIFSVILALFLNELRTNQKIMDDTDVALGNVILEIRNNLESVQNVKDYHKAGVHRMDSLLQMAGQPDGPGTKSLFQVFRIALPRGIQPPNTQNSAWNAMTTTGLVSELPYEKLYELTRLYKLQTEGVETTWKICAEHTLTAAAMDPSKTVDNLRLYRMLFNELYQQEDFLARSIEDTLEKVASK